MQSARMQDSLTESRPSQEVQISERRSPDAGDVSERISR